MYVLCSLYNSIIVILIHNVSAYLKQIIGSLFEINFLYANKDYIR